MRFVVFLITATLAIAGEFTTSLGDTYPYMVSAITTDSAGNTYVIGSRAFSFPTVAYLAINPFPVFGGTSIGVSPVGVGTISPFFSGGSDVFVTKLDPNGKVLFTDTFAGKGNDRGIAIALDPSGNIYIAGTTTSNDFPLSKALQTQPNSNLGTGFIIKLTNDGSTILYSTYFGGTLGGTSISSLATDSKGNLYLTGTTTAADFPHTAGMPFGQITASGPSQQTGAIVASISAAGDKILYSGALVGTALACSGGSSCFLSARTTAGVGIAVDAAGNAYVAGNTNTTDLAATAGTLSPKGYGAFVAKVNASGSGLSYLTYLGSGQNGSNPFISPATTLQAIAVDAAGNAYLAGYSSDPSLPVAPLSAHTNVVRATNPLGLVAKLKPDGSALVWATTAGTGMAVVQSIAVDASGTAWATGTTATPQGANQGWSNGPEFLVGVNNGGSALTYFARYPFGTVAQAVAVDSSGLVHVAGLNGFVSAIAPSTPPTMKIFAFQNAFGGNVTARISPAEVISIYGPGIGPATALSATPTNGFYPMSLSGVQVQINGANIPLLYVSANQINAVVPMSLRSNAAATVRVINGTTISPDYPVWIVPSAPQAFPKVLNQDGTINSASNPAKGGSFVTLYATGWQSTFYPLTDGQVTTAAQDSCAGSCYVFNLNNVAASATVLYGGAAPGIVAGVSQFNIRIGSIQSSAGTFPLSLQVGGTSSFMEIVWVKP